MANVFQQLEKRGNSYNKWGNTKNEFQGKIKYKTLEYLCTEYKGKKIFSCVFLGVQHVVYVIFEQFIIFTYFFFYKKGNIDYVIFEVFSIYVYYVF